MTRRYFRGMNEPVCKIQYVLSLSYILAVKPLTETAYCSLSTMFPVAICIILQSTQEEHAICSERNDRFKCLGGFLLKSSRKVKDLTEKINILSVVK